MKTGFCDALWALFALLGLTPVLRQRTVGARRLGLLNQTSLQQPMTVTGNRKASVVLMLLAG